MSNIKFDLASMGQTNLQLNAKLSIWMNNYSTTKLQTSIGDTKEAVVELHTSLNNSFNSIVTSARTISKFLGETIDDIERMDQFMKGILENSLENLNVK